MNPKTAVFIAQLISSLFVLVLIVNSWNFYFWPEFNVVNPRGNLTSSSKFREKDGSLILIDDKLGKYELVAYGREYKKTLIILKNYLKDNSGVNFDICKIASKNYIFNIHIGKKVFFPEIDVVAKLNSERQSVFRIIVYSCILLFISFWVIFEIKKWITENEKIKPTS